MAAWPNPALPLLLAALLAFEDWLRTPSCSGGPPEAGPASSDLRAMMVSDLMLLGSDSSYADRYFRDRLMSKFFANSIQTLKPDMIVVLGDISAKCSELTEQKWISVIVQFERILGRYSSLPLHIALGDKDVGTCANLDGKIVHNRAKHLPGLDSSGCGERESFADIYWRHNNMKSGSGPVVLLHFPLHKFDGEATDIPTYSEAVVSDHSSVSPSLKQSGANGRRLYDRSHTLPANSTQYILQALKPRIIFNGHAGTFSDFVHADGTREVTVPAMTWKTSEVPGFVIATFDAKGGESCGDSCH